NRDALGRSANYAPPTALVDCPCSAARELHRSFAINRKGTAMTLVDPFKRRIARLESEWIACGRVEPLRELHTAAVALTNDAERVLVKLRQVAADESAAFKEFEERYST